MNINDKLNSLFIREDLEIVLDVCNFNLLINEVEIIEPLTKCKINILKQTTVTPQDEGYYRLLDYITYGK